MGARDGESPIDIQDETHKHSKDNHIRVTLDFVPVAERKPHRQFKLLVIRRDIGIEEA